MNDGSDQRDFKSNLRPGTSLQWWREHLNFDAYYAFNCGNLIVNNSDMRPNENMMSYYHPDGQCHPIPWDLDLTFEDAPHLGRGDTPAWENIHRVLRYDEVDVPYQNRIRELLSLLFNGDQGDMLVDEYSRFIWVDVPPRQRAKVTRLVKDGAKAVVTTAVAHGFETGETVTIEGVDVAVFNGDKVITKISDTEFTYRGSVFASPPNGDDIIAFRTPKAKPIVLMDQAMWDHHPRKRKKDIYYKNIRGNDTEDFKGYQAYMKRFISPGGYGHDLLASHADETKAPDTPTITYTGADDYSVNDLSFEVSQFDGGSIFSPQEFAALQWRLAETTDPTRPDFDPSQPRLYEIEVDWQSEEITPFASAISIPQAVPRPGHTYRVRARMKNDAGHWSFWSDPAQFIAGRPDITAYAEGLVISELMYHPRAATGAERALGYSSSDFEYIELTNVGAEPLDLTHVRFTKGIDFGFAGSAITSIEPGAMALVVSNLQAFAHRYGNSAGFPIAGVYSGRLSNGGERVKLSYGAGTPILDFNYDDEGDWPARADGGGLALLGRSSPGEDLSLPGAWSLTAAVDGSPGSPEPDGLGLTFDLWQAGHFQGDELVDEEIAGLMADPDGDGVPNWVEYALSSHPREPDLQRA